MQFFNFWNVETYHFFQWVRYPQRVDVGNLITEAFDAAEHNDLHAVFDDTSRAVRDELGKFLQDIAEEAFADWFDESPDEVGIHCYDAPESYQAETALFAPLLANAVFSISYPAVAEALLIEAQRWAPDNTIPEIED